jgi:hypothetical protein
MYITAVNNRAQIAGADDQEVVSTGFGSGIKMQLIAGDY